MVDAKKLRPGGVPEDLAGPGPAPLREPGVAGGCREVRARPTCSSTRSSNHIYSNKQPGWDKFKEVYRDLNVSGARARFHGSSTTAGSGGDHARRQRVSVSEDGEPVRDRLPRGRDLGDRRRHGAGEGARPTRRRARPSSTGRSPRPRKSSWSRNSAGARSARMRSRCAALKTLRPGQARQVRHQERRRQAQGVHGQVAGACPVALSVPGSA